MTHSRPATRAVANGRPGAGGYDVIIIGARVAGASTAMLLARCGHRVLVVDRGSEGSDTVSTHTVLRLGVLQLQRWGTLAPIIDAGTPPIRKVTLGFGTELVPIELSETHGVDALYAPRRTILDQALVAAARDAGVDFLHGVRLKDLIRDADGRVHGVVLDGESGESVVRAKFAIGADGVWSKMAKLVGAGVDQSFPATNAVYYAYYRGIEADGVYFQFTPGATAGSIPTNDDEVCVYVGWPSDEIGEFRSEPDQAFQRQLARAHPDLWASVAGGERVSGFRGTPGLPGFLRTASGPGWALVGDAGFTKDPVSAHGISDALRDAELCARAVDQSLQHPGIEATAMKAYQRLRDQLSLPILELSSELAAYRWDAARASTLMREISIAVKDECDAVATLPEWPGVVRSLDLEGSFSR
jgi:flavin-dependent dehydrogenase